MAYDEVATAREETLAYDAVATVAPDDGVATVAPDGVATVAPVATASVVSPSPLSKCFQRVKHAERLGVGGGGGKGLGGTEALA